MKGRPVEIKVAASSIAALVVPAVFAAAAYYHWFTPPPAALQAAIIAVVTGIAGWLAPHTSRGVAAGLSDAERRRAENLRLMHDPNSPSFFPYPGETPATPPARPPAGNAP